jgi:hypothetical protein
MAADQLSRKVRVFLAAAFIITWTTGCSLKGASTDDNGATEPDTAMPGAPGSCGDCATAGSPSPGSRHAGEAPGAGVTSPDAAGAAGGAPAWSVTDIAGLALWLDETGFVPDAANPGHVARWKDRSPAKADGVPHLPLGCSGACAARVGPTYEPTMSAATLNGHRTLNFTAKQGVIVPKLLGTTDYSVVFVANVPKWEAIFNIEQFSVSLGTFAEGLNGQFARSGFAPFAFSWVVFAGAVGQQVTVPAPAVDRFQIFVLSGVTPELTVGSSTMKAMRPVAASATPVDLTIGSGGYVQTPTLDIAEVITTNTALTAADLAKLQAYLTAKFML